MKNNFCGQCGAKSSECSCNKNAADNKFGAISRTSYSCRVMIYTKLCGSTIGLTNVGTSEQPIHWCEKHYQERAPKSEIQKEIDRRAKLFADTAKEQGMTNYEFFQQYTGLDKPSDLIKTYRGEIKKTLSKQNYPYSQLTGEIN